MIHVHLQNCEACRLYSGCFQTTEDAQSCEVCNQSSPTFEDVEKNYYGQVLISQFASELFIILIHRIHEVALYRGPFEQVWYFISKNQLSSPGSRSLLDSDSVGTTRS